MANHQKDDFGNRLNAALNTNDLELDSDKVVDKKDEGVNVSSGLAYGMRIALEFMAGTVVGFLIGLGLDRYFDTSPWCLLVFTVFGFCAGILNVYRLINNIDEGIGINRQSVLTKAPKDNIPKHTN